MTAPGTRQTLNAPEAERAVVSLEKIMDQLEQTLTEETARVRAGRLRDAMNLDGAKIECARLYTLESERVIAAKDTIAKVAPALLDRLYDALRRTLERARGEEAAPLRPPAAEPYVPFAWQGLGEKRAMVPWERTAGPADD